MERQKNQIEKKKYIGRERKRERERERELLGEVGCNTKESTKYFIFQRPETALEREKKIRKKERKRQIERQIEKERERER